MFYYVTKSKNFEKEKLLKDIKLIGINYIVLEAIMGESKEFAVDLVANVGIDIPKKLMSQVLINRKFTFPALFKENTLWCSQKNYEFDKLKTLYELMGDNNE